MADSTVQMMVYANNATSNTSIVKVITRLSQCDQIVNLTEIVQNLYNLYQNTNSNIFSNLSIINFDCHTPSDQYFEQIITFTKSISIHLQVALAATYFDYITINRYSLHGFFIEQKESFNLSSITLNYTAKSDACSSGEAAQDSLCPSNSSTSTCIQSLINPWIFNCSINFTTSTTSLSSITHNYGLFSSAVSSLLNSWQIGLICGLIILFLLILFVIIGCFCRRHSRTKRIALSREYLVNDKKSRQKSEIPQDHIFQTPVRIIESKQSINTTISWIHDGNIKEKYIHLKPPKSYKQGIYLDCTKIHEPFYPSNISQLSNESIHTSNILIRKVSSPVINTSMNQLKLLTDKHSLDRSYSIDQRILNVSETRHYTNMSFTNENLHDEDAWMSILAVANAELELLNRLENEQNQTITIL